MIENFSNFNSKTDKCYEIDEIYYSRQLNLLGYDSIKKLTNTSNILISGMNGLGIEIAKNVILNGVKSITVHDQEICQLSDLSSQFYLTPQDNGRNRAEVSVEKLCELNNFVQVSSYTDSLSTEFISKFTIIILTESSNEEQLELAKYAHENGIAVIITQTAGLFGQIFCDFGDEFTCYDTTGEEPLSAMIVSISNDKEGVVSCLDGIRHGFQDGDYVTFIKIHGMSELNNCEPVKIKVLGPYSFSIGDTTSFSSYIRGGYAKQVKMPQKFKFKTFHEALKEPEFLYSYTSKIDRSIQLHIAFRALNEYKSIFDNQSPRPWNKEDAEKFLTVFSFILETEYPEHVNSIDKSLIEKFSFICSGNCSPIQAVLGGIVAQEVLKACTGKFVPIRQWFYYDALECLPLDDLDESDCTPINSRYDGQIAIFGKKFQEKLFNLNYFIVGAGGIGCELLKNFALMGIGCSSDSTKGQVIVTDMDKIEKSNLNRQFLFRLSDIGNYKALAASIAVKKINKELKIACHQNRVCPETENIYNNNFYERFDGIAIALDNIESRNYIDRRCIYNRKPLLESGILGTKGNNQVIIPHLTESYSSSQDPLERLVFKKFPIFIDDTLRWAKAEFDIFFSLNPEYTKEFLKDPNKFFEEAKDYKIDSVHELLIQNRIIDFKNCIEWARLRFEKIFNYEISQLLLNESTTNAPFYESKHNPRPIKFDIFNGLHIDYIVSAANLRAFIFNIPQCHDRRAIVYELAKIDVAKFTLNNQLNDEEKIDHLKKFLQLSKWEDLKINSIDININDDSNFHLDFIVSCSNLRAENYDIEQADRNKSRLIAGNIIPGIITITSVVAGLSCLELFKLVQGHTKLELFKNGFINLALPLFSFSNPIKAPIKKYYHKEFSLWDRFEVEGEMTLREFIDYFKNEHNLEITIITHGLIMIYSFFMSEIKLKERIDLTLTELIEKLSKKELDKNVKFLVFDISCNDLNGDDIEVPYVKYNISCK